MEKKAILFVDDEANILSALKRELRDFARERELEIRTAGNAPEALASLESTHESVVVIVSDLKMPELKGSDFLLRVHDLYPDIVTMLLTGFSETEEIMKAIKAGIHSFILKPWEPAYLRSELEKALELHEFRERERLYQKRMEDELRWAGEMQRALLKPNLPTSQGVEFRVSYRPVPSLYCGGDYYDVIYLGSDRYFMLVGDVAGHGVKAAFITGILKAVIFSEYVRGRKADAVLPGDFLSWLNERLNFELRKASGMLVTFFAGVLDVRNSTLRYANAGQNHPYVVRGAAPIELPVSGTALGVADKVSYPDQEVRLQPGDLVVLYTDGLVEPGQAGGGAGAVALGPILAAEAYGPDLHRRLLAAALAAAGAPEYDDDVTIVTAKLG